MSHKLTEEEKESQRQADLERLKQQTLENNKSFDPRLARRSSVQLLTPAPKETGETALPAAAQPAKEAGASPENLPIPESTAQRSFEIVRSEEHPPAPEDRIKPPSSTEESMAEKMLKLRRAADATKNNVRVTERVFSYVTDYAIARGVDKINIVTYLLYVHLPKKGQSAKSTPEYLMKEPPEGLRNRDLTFFEDPGLTERLGWVSSTYGLPRVDIIENIILNNLPIVEKKYPPKRRRKRRGRPAY
jgi:hypothetical protein